MVINIISVPRQKRNPKGNCWTEYLSALRSSRRSRRLPWCLTNGDYNLMQCHGSFCYCVTKDGTDVPGTKLSIFAGKPNCQNTGEICIELYSLGRARTVFLLYAGISVDTVTTSCSCAVGRVMLVI